MQILIATRYLGIVGGVETYLQSILPHLSASGLQIGVLADVGVSSATRGFLSDPVTIPTWDCDRTAAEVFSDVAAWKPDVIYSHGLANPILEAKLADQFPTVLYAHNYGGTCISGSKCHDFPVTEPCSRSFGSACLALYLPRRCGGLNPFTAVKAYGRERQRQRFMQRCRAVLVASRHMANELVRNGVPTDRVHLVPYPVTAVPDPSIPQPRPISGRVLFVGRLTRLKGWSHLLDAVPRAAAILGRKLTLIVAGDGPDRDNFVADARSQNVPVEFIGWVDPDKREAEMRAADILAVPSVWPEPFGLVGIEAGCVGLPAVGYAVGGIPDWLVPSVSGELAPGARPNPIELANAMVRAMDNPTHLQRLRVGAWESAGRFTLIAHLERLIPILEAAAGS